MKAIGYKTPLPISDPNSLMDIEIETPTPTGHDLLVEVKAISVNPADVKMRATSKPEEGQYKILGWDASGIVKAVGTEATLFKPGDEVFYAGSITRPGTNSEFHLVDERIVGKKPKSLDFSQAAALPLTTLTGWELLFDRLLVPRDGGEGSILVTGAAGGVGSILLQIARHLTKLHIIATASRPETRDWCLALGAHSIIDHTKSMPEQIENLGVPPINYVASLNATEEHYPALVELLAPQGRIGVIDDPETLDSKPLKRKAATISWELMFTRSMFQTPDMVEQHHILDQLADLVDKGTIRTTSAHDYGTINAANLRKAHALLETGRSHGKIVLTGF
jgi:NADPH2:quinone reductase